MAVRRARLRAGPLRALAAVLAVLAACAEDRSPAEQAATVCGTTIEWRDELGDLVEVLSRAGVRIDDPGERKRLILRFLDDAEDRTEVMLDETRDELPLDEPAARERLAEAARELTGVWDGARALARSFPEEADEEPFYSRGTQITSEVELTGAVWKAALADIAELAPELRAAMADEPACTRIPRTADR